MKNPGAKESFDVEENRKRSRAFPRRPNLSSPSSVRRKRLVLFFLFFFLILLGLVHQDSHDGRSLQDVGGGSQRQVDDAFEPTPPVEADAVFDGGAGVEHEALPIAVGKVNHQSFSAHRLDTNPIDGNYLADLKEYRDKTGMTIKPYEVNH